MGSVNREYVNQQASRRTQIVAAVGILATSLLACVRLPVGIHLSEETADAVMQYIRASDPSADFAEEWTISCWALKGVYCKVVEPKIAEPDLGELTSSIVNEIGSQYIEHAVNNNVTIHCAMFYGDLGDRWWECDINGGSDWEDLSVR